MTDRQMLAAVALAIDWDQQDCSRYYIGEDIAQTILMHLGNFPWGEGVCNEAVERFVKTPTITK